MVKIFLMAVIGISAGIVVSGGLYSFIVGLKVISHMAVVTNTKEEMLLYENSVMMGGILGNIAWIFQPVLNTIKIMPGIFGICAGIFVGCWSMAILEALRGFPIFVRKTGLLNIIQWLILILAVGKMSGSFIYFFAF